MLKILKDSGSFIVKNIDDIFIIGGFCAFVIATFLINTIAGIYVLGASLLILGILFMFRLQRKPARPPIPQNNKNVKRR